MRNKFQAMAGVVASALYLAMAIPAVAQDTDHDGFVDGLDSNPVSRAWLPWGDTNYTSGNDLSYSWPGWMVGAFQNGGEWKTNAPTAWHVPSATSSDTGTLHAEVDRSILTNDAVYRVDLFDASNATLYIDLYDTNAVTVATNLYGNILTGHGAQTVANMTIPFVASPGAVGVRLRRGVGEITVYSGQLYVDRDGDGLDEDQESQLGSSDGDADSDNDGLSDWAEVFTWSTSPTVADTDGDGMNDGDEVAHGRNPVSGDAYSWLPFTEVFETNTVHLGLLHGQNNWTVSPTNLAAVQSQVVYAGQQALGIGSDTNISDTTVEHLFAAPPGADVWVDLHMRTTAGLAPTGQVSDSAAFYFSQEGWLVVYDGYQSAWETYSNTPALIGDWSRVTVNLDYAAREWLIALDGVLVAQEIGFAGVAQRFSSIAADSRYGYADDMTVSTTVPTDLSLDGDSLPDYWEMQYFGSTSASHAGDADSDGLTNLQEYQLGLDPTALDSDGDVMSDGDEALYGFNPSTSNSYASLPFVEFFETNTVHIGELGGQNGWTISTAGLALVQSSIVCSDYPPSVVTGSTARSSLQALAMGDISNTVLATAEHFLGRSGSQVAWMDFFAKVTASEPTTDTPDDSAAFLFNSNGTLVVYDGHLSGNKWVALSEDATIPLGDWTRITVRLDYSSQEWAICLNDLVVADGLGFGGSATELSRWAVDARYGYMDDLAVSADMPYGISMDYDHLPDAWELEQFWDLSHTDTSDPDGDGLYDRDEYVHATDPLDADVDGDGLGDWYELFVSGSSPFAFDSAGDGLSDAWKLRYGIDPNTWTDPNTDPDGDGLTNLEEAQTGTNPYLADNDGDGVSDGDELNVTNTDPLIADQGSSTGGPTLTITRPKDGEQIL